MKRAVSFFILLASVYTAGNAQYFVEGRLGVRYHSDISMFNDVPPNFYLNVSPLAGYRINNKMAVGTKASLIRQKETGMMIDKDTGNEVEFELSRPGWSLAVFARNKLWGTKKISFLVESSLFRSGDSFIRKKETIVIEGTTYSSFGINMLPLVTFELSDRLSLIAACEFLSLDLSSRTTSDHLTDFIQRRYHFGFTGKSTIFRYSPYTRVGVIYYFKNQPK